MDDSSSEPSDSEDPEADDYNPFGGSDNEDPWCRSEKNGRSKGNSSRTTTSSI